MEWANIFFLGQGGIGEIPNRQSKVLKGEYGTKELKEKE